MDGVAALDKEERALLFRQAAADKGVDARVMEKDFWVCWSLKKIFALEGHPDLLFKGGTSLSKVFGLISRFSEDVDLSVDRRAFGFTGDRDPTEATGKNERKRLVKDLNHQCHKYIEDRLAPALREVFAFVLGDEGEAWHLKRDTSAPATLLFDYPTEDAKETLGYMPEQVRLELGAFADHEPSTEHPVYPYACEHYPGYFEAPTCVVKVLDAERTFWEKVTILHAHSHGGPDRAVNRRLSRHYYDVFQLAGSGVREIALGDLPLLERVVRHKTAFYGQAWAKYDEACPGTLRLVPDEALGEVLAADYAEMQTSGFFYGEEPPSFDDILGRLTELELEINESPR